MFGKMSFNYNISFIFDVFNANNASRVVFGSDSRLIFKKSGECLVDFLYLGRYVSINVEHVDGDKICRLNVDTKTGKAEIYTYDAVTDDESSGMINNKVRDSILKTAKVLYERRSKIYKIENNISSEYLEFVADDGRVFKNK